VSLAEGSRKHNRAIAAKLRSSLDFLLQKHVYTYNSRKANLNPARQPRLDSIDILRGLVIVIMALDHVRDYFSASAGIFEPTDLSRTTIALFFTRWITHFCAPIFVFLAGTGSYLSLLRGRTPAQLSYYLLTRGLWLVFLEIFVISPLGWSFQLDLGLIRLQVIWAIGIGMIVLAALCRFHPAIPGAIGLAMIAFQNLLDGSKLEVWKLLHSITFHQPIPGHRVASLYPLIPWVGVLLAGFGAGVLFRRMDRVKPLAIAAATAVGLFTLLRSVNQYGDPAHWSAQSTSAFTVLSWLNVSKYPPSLDYLLITLGIAAAMLATLEANPEFRPKWLETFGRVPLFFYLIHLPLIHGAAVAIAYIQYGSAEWLFQDPFGLRRGANAAPPGYGFDLPIVYMIWFCVILATYPVCRRYSVFKRSTTNPVWSYL